MSEEPMQATVREDAPSTKEERLASLRMWAFVRRDLDMPDGKLVGQGGHAFVDAFWQTLERGDVATAQAYMRTSQAKAVVYVRNEAELRKMVQACRDAGLATSLVDDAGHTVFDGRTPTCGAVGPCLHADLPKVVQRARLLNRPIVPDREWAGPGMRWVQKGDDE